MIAKEIYVTKTFENRLLKYLKIQLIYFGAIYVTKTFKITAYVTKTFDLCYQNV